MNKEKAEALAFIVQVVNDFAALLPVSARAPFSRQAQAVIQVLEKPDPPQAEAK
jgi:hypothetical protein